MAIRTPQDIAKLPKFSKTKATGVYKVTDRVYVDNVEGLGATKIHKDIRNKGFVNRMPLALYEQLCACQPDAEAVAEVEAKILEGHGIACPQVYIDIDNYMAQSSGKCKVMDHYGLSTCAALRKLGVEEIEVQFVFLGYLTRNLESPNDFFNWIARGVVSEAGEVVKIPVNHV